MVVIVGTVSLVIVARSRRSATWNAVVMAAHLVHWHNKIALACAILVMMVIIVSTRFRAQIVAAVTELRQVPFRRTIVDAIVIDTTREMSVSLRDHALVTAVAMVK